VVFVAPERNQPVDEARPMCGRVRCPVLVVRAEHSEVFAESELDAVIRSFPSATGAELPGSGHMVMWESPSEVAWLAIEFLTR
jgi:pimeloyl-ACP methyl ester carboxylesterase